MSLLTYLTDKKIIVNLSINFNPSLITNRFTDKKFTTKLFIDKSVSKLTINNNNNNNYYYYKNNTNNNNNNINNYYYKNNTNNNNNINNNSNIYINNIYNNNTVKYVLAKFKRGVN